MIILGLDPGLNKTGFGIIKLQNNTNIYIASGIINSSKYIDNNKLGNIVTQLKKIIEEYKPNYCSIENFFFSKHIRSIMQLSQARGACVGTVSSFGIRIDSYSPKTVKKVITGNGNSTKNIVQEFTYKHLNISGKSISYDSSDALAIALTHSFTFNSTLITAR